MMTEMLSQVDLAFVVDTTGSMGGFIADARRQMTDMLGAAAGAAPLPIDLRVGVVEYRDHPPQDASFAARAHAFASDLGEVRDAIAALQPAGGGDGPEAVFDGLAAACRELEWRPHACRLAVLIGDAPPHGLGGRGDGFPKGCPCGLTTAGATALLEGHGVVLYALGLTPFVKESFTSLALWTGGEYFEANRGQGAIDAVREVIAREFEGIDVDRRVLELCRATPDWTMDGVSERLASGRSRVAASLSRLGRRGLLTAVR
jgi:hypothetical protein